MNDRQRSFRRRLLVRWLNVSERIGDVKDRVVGKPEHCERMASIAIITSPLTIYTVARITGQSQVAGLLAALLIIATDQWFRTRARMLRAKAQIRTIRKGGGEDA